jgi:hypothetical protein
MRFSATNGSSSQAARQIASCHHRNSKSSGQEIPARSMPTTTALRRAYFHDIKSPVQVDREGQSSRSEEYLHRKWTGSRRSWGWCGRPRSIGFRRIGLRPVSPCGRGGGRLSGRKVQGSLLMQLRKMNENRGRNVRTPTARLVQSEHLKASRNGEEEDRRRKEHSNNGVLGVSI